MALEQEKVPERVILVVSPRYGNFDDDEFRVSSSGEVLFEGNPSEAMTFCLAFRKNCPGVVDTRIQFPLFGQAALMGMRAAFEMFPGKRKFVVAAVDKHQAPV